MTRDQLTDSPAGPTPCRECGHWIGGPEATPPYDCPTCGTFVPALRGGR